MTAPNPLIEYKVARLEEDLARVTLDLASLRQERALEERRRLKWGIGALGAIVLSLAGAIWAMLPTNVQHVWDLVRGPR
ncbi:hypothetical protein P6F26_16905 [Roseibacterium sp. SDUM158017]|uniref:hypothetical protein n=1 Tax=Roseicyclus salinarum TaxID=3036773 RepID=UPI002414E5FC|nr:hypothetical protein [Roseibacterium sp. SDUM158017]MDG4650130.1 hypothetical protein [Roseibacterium sp. SDUM158017]